MTSHSEKHDAIYALWDELVDHPTARAEEALSVLMQRLCDLLDARNCIYFSTVRFSRKGHSKDPVKRWRVHTVSYLHPSVALLDAAKEQLKNYQRGEFNLLDIRNVEHAGSFRVNRLVDLVPADWFESPFYQRHYRGLDHVDAIWAGVPVNEEAEVFCGVFRDASRPAFSVEERELFGQALRGLKWFHRQLLLNRGVMVAEAPLTDMEQLVLQGMLSGKSEKQIAVAMAHSVNTTHQHIKTIYRKFGVRNRSSLMALWLGESFHPPNRG